MKPKLYEQVAVTRDIPEEGLKRGDVATIVEYLEHPSGGEEGAILEIFNSVGDSIGIATVPVSAITTLDKPQTPMTKQRQVHIQPRQDAAWEIKKSDDKRPPGVFRTKREAEQAGRQMSKNQGSEVVIHRKDGTIKRKDSHGNDPNPPKDTK